MNKLKINFILHGLYYNNNKDAINKLKELGKYEQYQKYDKKEVEYHKNINKISLEINDDDTIDYIKKKLSVELYNKLEKNSKTCHYCFSNSNNKNEVINTQKTEEDIFQDIFTIDKKKFKKKQDEDEESDFDLSPVDDDDDDLDKLLEEDFVDDDDDESDSLASISIGPSLTSQRGAGKKKNKKIFICHNCRKIYFFNGFDVNNTDIFPFAELFYLWSNEEIIGHDIINNQKKKIELEDFMSPFKNIKKIDGIFLGILRRVSKDEKKRKEVMKNKELTNLFQNIYQAKKIYHKYFKNNTFLLYKNYQDTSEVKTEVNLSYLPEISLYHKDKIKSLDLYSKLYWPYIDFKYYHTKFIEKNLSELKRTKYILYGHPREKNDLRERGLNKKGYLGKEGLYSKIQQSDNVIIEFEKLKELDNKNFEEFTNKIFYKINDNDNTNVLINFNNILHLFDLEEDFPYLSSYIPEESIILEKIYKNLEDEIKLKDWSLNNKNIIQFKLLLPKEIFDDDTKHYFQVNLYENMKLEVSISIPTEFKIYVSQKKLLKINDKVNNLIKKLNKTNIFHFSDIQLPLSNETFENWNKDKETTKINSMNFYLKVQSKVNKKNIDDIIGNLASNNNSNGCMREYFYKDFNTKINNYRYKRINNVDISEITDRFIYHNYKNIIENDKVGLTENKINIEIIKNIGIFFDKTEEESIAIFQNYLLKYKGFNIKPSNYGLLFNIKEPDEWQNSESEFYNYKITLMGMRDYKDWVKIKSFILKLFYIIESISNKTANINKFINICTLKEIKSSKKDIIKKDLLTKYQEEKSKCWIDSNTLKGDKKMKYNDKQKQQKKLEKRIKELQKLISEKENQLGNYKDKDFSYLKKLQEYFPNLNLYCDKCAISTDSKECHSCNELISQNDYTTTCGRYKQPMGTGPGYVPEIIDFVEKNERKKLDQNVVCNINQDGGNQTLDSYFKKIDVLLQTKLKIKKCKYNKQEIKELIKLYDISSKKTKDELCYEILNKVRTEEKDTFNKIVKILKDIRKDEKNENNISSLNFLIEYYNRDIKDYNFRNKEELNKIIKTLKLKIDLDISDKNKKEKILDNLLEIFSKNYEINKEKYIIFFDLDESFQKFNYDSIKKQIIFYNIYKLTNEWKENHIKKIFETLTGLTTINKKKKDLIIEIEKRYKNFENKYLKLNEVGDIEEEPLEKEKKEKKIISDNYEEEKFIKDTELLLKKDKYNNVIKSVIKFRGKALTCPNYSNYDHSSGNKEFLIGFQDFSKYRNKYNLSDSKLRNLLCKPCCFGPKKDKKNNLIIKPDYARNVLFCKQKINWNEYLQKVENEQRIENYTSTNDDINKYNSFGKLQNILHNYFNNYHNLYNKRNNKQMEQPLFSKFSNNLLKSPGFVLKGMKQLRNIILLIFSDLLVFPILEQKIKKINNTKDDEMTNEEIDQMYKDHIISVIEKKLKSNSKIFKSLNGGKLAIRFNNIDEYIQYLKGDIIDIRWFIEVISIPNLFQKYPKGFNVIIFKTSKRDIKVRSYKDINFEDYYNINKNHLFLYEYSSGELEPIVLKSNKKTINFLSIDDKNLLGIFKKEKNIINYMNDFINFNKDFVMYFFRSNNELISNLKMLKIIENTKYNFKLQIIDNFNKSLFILTENNNLIPVEPSKFDYNKNILVIENVKDLNKYLKNVENSVKFINKFAKDINNNNYDFSKKFILDEKKEMVVGIELSNKLMLPVKPENYNKLIEKYPSTTYPSTLKLYYEINNALYKKSIPDIDIDFIKEKYDFELYQRLLLEFSNYITKKEEEKNIILDLIKSNLLKDKEIIKQMIIEIFDKILIYKEPETINYNKFLKYSKKENLRQLCDVKQDFFCIKDNNQFKLVVPLNKKNMFIGVLLETLLNKEQQRTKILNNNINRIINIHNFINNQKHIFVKKEPDFTY